MSLALVTVIASIPPDRIAEVRRLIDSLGNPAREDIRKALDAIGVIHFASVNLFEASMRDRGHLALEISGDGEPGKLLDLLAEQLGGELDPIFRHAPDRGTGALGSYWKAKSVAVGPGWFGRTGLAFSGTPGLSVQRIRDECKLAEHIAEMLDRHSMAGSAVARLDAIRAELRADQAWKWALESEPALGAAPTRTNREATLNIAGTAIRTFLWPLALPPLATLLIDWWSAGFAWQYFASAIGAAIWAALLTALAFAALAGGLYAILRQRERAEVPLDRAPDPKAVAAIAVRENLSAQNHVAALSVMKPGWLRRLALRGFFWFIAQRLEKFYKPGFLGTIGTIHFARWVMVPGTGDLLFLSNYDGSWESYLEDFITKEHGGLSLVWSNTVGFPKTENFYFGGASDGERFKRWARRQQIPTGFWYSAYPDLSAANIRTNAAIRQGLGAALTEDEARRWFALFGSEIGPPSTLEEDEIQSLVFGGLGFLRFGACLVFSLSDDRSEAKAWLRDVLPSVTYGEGRGKDEAVILGLAATALRKLGLPDAGLATFPAAYLDGMCAPWRARALGDTGNDDPGKWRWGGDAGIPADGVMLIYAKTAARRLELRAAMLAGLEKHGHRAAAEIRFRPTASENAPARFQQRANREPFGFRDGVSQPVIRGTRKAERAADPLHLVAAGEFILGYPDNRGRAPPPPTLPAIHDPAGALPLAADPAADFAHGAVNDARDLGRNGTFLAIRQLEQDAKAFRAYCEDAAAGMRSRFPAPDLVTAEFIAAKMVGRWQDGSSLLRYPDAPPKAAAAVPDNEFRFGGDDPQGRRCPLGAHIRRANPRDSFEPGAQRQIDVSNRHRILRVGRPYVPRKGEKPGLLFMCLNGDLERQFEFVQQTWVQGRNFHGLGGERDPIIGDRSQAGHFTIPTSAGPVRLKELPSFVAMRGGGYFFVPGRRLLGYLAAIR